MQVAADRVLIDRSGRAIPSVVAASDPHLAHRLGVRTKVRQSAVVFETNELTPLAIDHHIANEAITACFRYDVEQADAGKLFSVVRPVFMPMYLISPANRKKRGSAFDRVLDRLALGALKIAR